MIHLALGLALALTLTAEPGAEKPKLLVTALTPAGGVTPEVAGAITEAITTEVAQRGFFQPMSAQDIQTILGSERQRQLMGCSEDSGSCLSELAGAMGARFVVSGTLAKLGGSYQLTLQTLDTARAQPLGRSTRIARDLEQLRDFLPVDVATATATALPEPPSRLVQYSLMGAGGVVALVGALATFDSVTREGAVSRELAGGLNLRPVDYYRTQNSEIALERGLGIAAIAAGGALIGAGIWLLPSSSSSMALVPSPHGVALVGVFP